MLYNFNSEDAQLCVFRTEKRRAYVSKQTHLYCMKKPWIVTESEAESGIWQICDNVNFLGPRLRQHHSHHQKPSVEKHWAASWGRPNREKYQWLSAPACQGGNVWNQTETQRTRPWTDPPACEIWVHLLQAPQHISYSLSTPLCWLTRGTRLVGLNNEI